MTSDHPGEVRQVIWMRDQAARRGPKPAHTREDIARAAVAIADEHGLEEVSIRAVAGRLGAGAASLYRYIAGKADLHDLMVDAVMAELDLPDEPTGDWRTDVTTIAEQTRAVHRRHPWAFSLLADASWGPHIQTYLEHFLAALYPTGLSLGEQMELIAHVNAAVATFAANEAQRLTRSGAGDELQRAQQLHLEQISADPDLPHLSAAVREALTAEPPDTDGVFRRMVERLLASVGQDVTDRA